MVNREMNNTALTLWELGKLNREEYLKVLDFIGTQVQVADICIGNYLFIKFAGELKYDEIPFQRLRDLDCPSPQLAWATLHRGGVYQANGHTFAMIGTLIYRVYGQDLVKEHPSNLMGYWKEDPKSFDAFCHAYNLLLNGGWTNKDAYNLAIEYAEKGHFYFKGTEYRIYKHIIYKGDCLTPAVIEELAQRVGSVETAINLLIDRVVGEGKDRWYLHKGLVYQREKPFTERVINILASLQPTLRDNLIPQMTGDSGIITYLDRTYHYDSSSLIELIRGLPTPVIAALKDGKFYCYEGKLLYIFNGAWECDKLFIDIPKQLVPALAVIHSAAAFYEMAYHLGDFAYGIFDGKAYRLSPESITIVNNIYDYLSEEDAQLVIAAACKGVVPIDVVPGYVMTGDFRFYKHPPLYEKAVKLGFGDAVLVAHKQGREYCKIDNHFFGFKNNIYFEQDLTEQACCVLMHFWDKHPQRGYKLGNKYYWYQCGKLWVTTRDLDVSKLVLDYGEGEALTILRLAEVGVKEIITTLGIYDGHKLVKPFCPSLVQLIKDGWISKDDADRASRKAIHNVHNGTVAFADGIYRFWSLQFKEIDSAEMLVKYPQFKWGNVDLQAKALREIEKMPNAEDAIRWLEVAKLGDTLESPGHKLLWSKDGLVVTTDWTALKPITDLLQNHGIDHTTFTQVRGNWYAGNYTKLTYGVDHFKITKDKIYHIRYDGPVYQAYRLLDALCDGSELEIKCNNLFYCAHNCKLYVGLKSVKYLFDNGYLPHEVDEMIAALDCCNTLAMARIEGNVGDRIRREQLCGFNPVLGAPYGSEAALKAIDDMAGKTIPHSVAHKARAWVTKHNVGHSTKIDGYMFSWVNAGLTVTIDWPDDVAAALVAGGNFKIREYYYTGGVVTKLPAKYASLSLSDMKMIDAGNSLRNKEGYFTRYKDQYLWAQMGFNIEAYEKLGLLNQVQNITKQGFLITETQIVHIVGSAVERNKDVETFFLGKVADLWPVVFEILSTGKYKDYRLVSDKVVALEEIMVINVRGGKVTLLNDQGMAIRDQTDCLVTNIKKDWYKLAIEGQPTKVVIPPCKEFVLCL